MGNIFFLRLVHPFMSHLSYTLAPIYYFDETLYHQEKEKIFYSSWQYACHKSQIKNPGDFVSFQVADESLFAIKGKDNVIRAFYNVCPHRGHPLVQKDGHSQMIVCPYHAWSFFTDGSLCKARGSECVLGFNKADMSLQKVHVEEFLGFIFVNLAKNPASIKSMTGELEWEISNLVPQISKLVFAHRIPYRIKANWKLVVDNYLECYHCPPSHPDFVKMVDLKSYRTRVYENYVSQIGNTVQKDPQDSQTKFGAWWLWPNICLTVFCGQSNITIMNIQPQDKENTIENFDFFFLDQKPSPKEEETINYIYEKLQPEDVMLVENVQKGLKSRSYKAGPLLIDRELTENSEHGLKAFHDLLRKNLT